MSTLSTIKRTRKLLERNITTTDATLSYDRIVSALELLGDVIDDYDGYNEDWIYVGENSYSIDSIIVGAYWHLTEYHTGQSSDSYRALCSLGKIFSPGMSYGPELYSCENDIYKMLNDLAEKQ